MLERLPFKANDPVARQLSGLRAELQRDPRNRDVAVALARRYYGMVAEEGDPRYLGYAEAALAPWWNLPEPPVDVQVMRASIRQFRHDFDGAVDDLNQVIRRDPANAQALALRAVIHIVQARYGDARKDCIALHEVGDPHIGLGCEAMVDGLTGHAEQGYRTLSEALAQARGLTPPKRMWLLIRLAELAERIDRPDLAEAHFKDALGLDITDTFLLAAYADLLLSQHRAAETLTLLRDKTRSDVLLLRLVLAARETNAKDAPQLEETLAARYEAAQLRGDTVHQQEESRFALQVKHDPQRALRLAQENWKVQREPRDAQVFLEAAVAAKAPDAARPVLEWLEQNHLQDKALHALAQRLKGERS
ncbi:hypothetical protein E4K72_10435 [Oxalobacteraceae bacterium OM1]|nr:hypothetical protein E4K72_10435 [Oxalobacteraceae bacterium OM1]